MKRIGIISDTHDNLDAVEAAAKVFREESVDLVVHAGDIVAPFTLKLLCELLGEKVPLYAVFGNNCGEKMGLKRVAESCGVKLSEPPIEILVENKRLLVLHGYGSKTVTTNLVDSLARGGPWDVIIYGHTHDPRVDQVSSTLIVNPGEACGCLTGKRSVAILDLEAMEVSIKEI